MAQEMRFEEVPVEKLRWRCDPERLKFQSTEDFKHLGDEDFFKKSLDDLNVRIGGDN